ncbi:MAG: hypothetical protein AB7Y46_02120 [Armatimonadota bacterium]
MLPAVLALVLCAGPPHSGWGADGELVNVATVRDYANAVASAKTRQRYVDGPERVIDGRADPSWRASDPGPQGIGIDRKAPRPIVRVRLVQADCAEPDFAELLPCANRAHFRNEFGPRLVAADPDAQVLGRYAHNSQPGLVRKRGEGFTSVFRESCFMPREVLAWIAREAGAPPYCEDPRVQVSACRSWLVARNLTGETLSCALSLKRPGPVVDAFTGEALASAVTSFTAGLEAWETPRVWLRQVDRQVGGQRLAGALLMPYPMRGADVALLNRRLLADLDALGDDVGPDSRGAVLVTPQCRPEQVAALARHGRVVGLKPYDCFASRRNSFDTPLASFLPEWAWELAEERGLVIVIHLLHRRALGDPRNQRALAFLCRRWRGSRARQRWRSRGRWAYRPRSATCSPRTRTAPTKRSAPRPPTA